VTPRAVGLWLVALVGAAALCLALGRFVEGDPMLFIELGGLLFVLAWVALLVADVVRSSRAMRTLSNGAYETTLFGAPCLVAPSLGMDALVVGSIRPRIFVGAAMLSRLSEDELRAVVYHEDHHRRVLAPLRAAALTAWLRLLGRSGTVRVVVMDRLADLESLADADAIRRGSSPRALARALLQGESASQPAAFSFAAERRVSRLLGLAADMPEVPSYRMPYEWLPVALLAVAAVSCHLGL